jgi:NADH dehydrogenase
VTPTRLVIVGGGFAGVACARTLRARLSEKECEIVVFNPENHMVFHPLLAEVAGASVSPGVVAAPLRGVLKDVECRTERVVDVDVVKRTVTYSGHDGLEREMTYDHVVLACGRPVNLSAIQGMADHAFPLKTAGDAIALRSHVLEQLEKAAVCDDPERARWYRTFLVVGGGFSGVEVAGEINDLVHASRRFYPGLERGDWQVTVVHAPEHLLPEVGQPLRQFAKQRMERAGIEVLLGARASAATPEGVWLRDGRLLRGATIVCTIGTSATPVIERMRVPKVKGRVETDPQMRVRGSTDAWAVGDCAANVNEWDGEVSPTTAQFAQRQGRQVADNIVSTIFGWPLQPFRFRPLGQLCAIGGRSAVAELMGLRIAGFPAWVLWRTIYLMKLPEWSKRIRAGGDWAWQFVFGRDLMHLKASPSERVSHAHYQPGDYVFRQGEQAASLYIIESGEAEVLRERGGGEQTVAVLRSGDFFGEMALLAGRPHGGSVRARTPLSLVVVGRTVFEQLSSSLAPLQELIAAAARRRNTDPWRALPVAHDVLSRASLSEFLELGVACVGPDASFATLIQIFGESAVDVCYVVNGAGELCGSLTRSRLLRGVETVAAAGEQRGAELVARDLMEKDPVYIERADSALLAAEALREHGVERLPVIAGHGDRRLVGVVRAERILAYVLRQAQPREGVAARERTAA